MIYVGPAARAAVIVKRPAAALSRAARAIQHLPPGTIVASLFLYCGPVAAIFLTVPRCVNVRVPGRVLRELAAGTKRSAEEWADFKRRGWRAVYARAIWTRCFGVTVLLKRE